MTILILQLLPRQFRYIQQRYSGPHTLSFMETTKRPNIAQTRKQIDAHDKVLLPTKFASHGMASVIPSTKLLLAHGGMSDILRVLGQV